MSEDRAFFQGVLVVPEGAVESAVGTAERVLTLATLRAALREHFAPEMELADPTAVRLALAAVAPEVVRGDAWLGPIARRGGRAWLRIVDALDEAVGALADRADALEVVARGHDGVAGRARLLGWLMRAQTHALLDAGLVDPRREAERVADVLAHADPSDVALALSSVVVRARGIVDWSPADLALWRVLDASLSRVGGRAAIELPVFERPLDAERERDPLDALIEAVASALDDAPLATPITSSLGDLRPRSAAPVRGAARVEVRQAIGAGAQGRAVADAVHAALRDGVSPTRIVVALVSDDEESACEILRALGDADIPVADVRRVRPRRSNLVATAELSLEVAQRGSRRGDVALLLRSAYVDPRALLGQADADAGRRVLRDLARALEETPTAHGDTPAERLAATVVASAVARKRGALALGQAMLLVGQSLARVAEGTTRAAHLRSARALWRDLGLGHVAPSAALARPGSASRVDLVDLAARRRDEEAWRALLRTLSSYERSLARLGIGDLPATLEAFRHEVAWASSRTVLPPSDSPLAVRVLRFVDLVGDDARVVVLADADRDAWPDGRARAELVAPELEGRLAEASDPALRPIVHSGAEQAIARLALATRAAERVVFTYRARDEDGGARSPAPVISMLGEAATATLWPSGQGATRPLSERDWLLGELARNPDASTALLPDAARRARLERRREESFGARIASDHPLAHTLPTGEPFASILSEETGGGSRPLAASALDGLASCVFKGFVSEVLRPKRNREAHDVADARETGHLAHAGLEEAFRATAPLWSARPRDAGEILRVGIAAADRVLAREQVASELARLAIDQVRAGVRAVLEWSLADLAWDFTLAEQSFGEGGVWDPVVLEHDGVRVSLRGRIDRIDLAHDSSSVRVIDYKTRERSAEAHTAAFGTTKFQLAIYARAAQAGLDRAGGEGLYVATQRLRPGATPKKHLARWVAAHEVVDGVPSFERRVASLVGELRRGELSVRPFAAASCSQCDFDGVCRKPRFAPSAPVDDRGDADDAR